METPENPRAYPSAAIDDKYGGMRLRDKFAGNALQGIVTSADGGLAGWSDFSARAAAKSAYQLADAMLAERDTHRAAL